MKKGKYFVQVELLENCYIGTLYERVSETETKPIYTTAYTRDLKFAFKDCYNYYFLKTNPNWFHKEEN